jgi:hypothetical protein
MRIAFVDSSGWQYSVETPFERPMGGSQSALCYLAAELARLGLAVTIFNGSTKPSESHGVAVRNQVASAAPDFLNGFDVAIAQNAAIGLPLRREMQTRIPLVLWNQHSYDQPQIARLIQAEERESWSSYAFVSEWQRDHFVRQFSVPLEKSRVMRNAMAPAFASRKIEPPWFATGQPPTLFYSSTPFRGLDVLLQAFPAIRSAVPGTRLRIFSSMGVYQVPAEKDEFRDLYSRARYIKGVQYVGSVGQRSLAKEIAGAAALAYPSTFAETSCIAVIEAMAA